MLSQLLQGRSYAVAAEETNKGVVSGLASGNDLGYMKLKSELYRIPVIPSCKATPRII